MEGKVKLEREGLAGEMGREGKAREGDWEGTCEGNCEGEGPGKGRN